MSLDDFLGRAYDRRRYNCAHLAIDVWQRLTSREVAGEIASFLVPGSRPARLGHVAGARILRKPIDACFVLMRSPAREPHMGVFHRGRVIHFAGNRKVQFQPIDVATFGYTRVRYFTC